MARRIYDVLIIGAGAAGLAAAAEIARARRSALVVEARERIGGRCWSRALPGFPVPVELGAEFIHGRPAATTALLEKAGLAAVDAVRDPWIVQSGRLVPRADFFSQIQAAMRASRMLEKRDVAFGSFLRRELVPRLSEEAATYARMLVEGYDAADPKRASARAIVAEWTGADTGTLLSRPLGGYGVLVAALGAGLAGSTVELRLQTWVRGVRWRRGSVAIEAASLDEAFHATAARALITLPLGVLQLPQSNPGAVRFTPALRGKRAALRGLAAGAAIKLNLRFRRAFWETLDRGRYRDATFFHSPHAAFPTFWTALPVRVPLLTAWSGGPKAARLCGTAAPAIVRAALASLRTVFGTRVRLEEELTAAHVHDWQRDPCARGAYSYVVVGGEGARAALAANVAETLYFAGEAVDCEGEAGTVAGALQSGRRAARELLRGL